MALWEHNTTTFDVGLQLHLRHSSFDYHKLFLFSATHCRG